MRGRGKGLGGCVREKVGEGRISVLCLRLLRLQFGFDAVRNKEGGESKTEREKRTEKRVKVVGDAV